MSRITLLIIASIIFSCTKSNPNLSREEEMKWNQYRVHGKSLYLINCANCHGREGEGLAKLYPPLKNADWVSENSAMISCVIRNGIKGEMIINEIQFSGDMPGHDDLTNLEIAEIVAYVLSDLNDETEFYDVNEVVQQLNTCED